MRRRKNMKAITLYYDEILTNSNTGKHYHYVNPKPYTWLIDSEFEKNLNKVSMPAMTQVLTKSKPGRKAIIIDAYIANVQTRSDIEDFKPLVHDDFKPRIWHVNAEQEKRLNYLITKIQKYNKIHSN